MLNTRMHKQTHSLQNQMTLVDGILKLIILQLVDALQPLLGAIHRDRPPLCNLVDISLWPVRHYEYVFRYGRS